MAELKKLILKIGDKEISLTPGEAKELKNVLNDLFGEPVKEIHHYDFSTPWHRRYYGPMWMVEPSQTMPDVVYCSATKQLETSLASGTE